MSEIAKPDENTSETLADRLRKLREKLDLSLDDVATEAGISKTYLWELERDTAGTKKPSAAVLLRIAKALKTTLADVLALQSVQAPEGPVELPPGLPEFRDRMGDQLSVDDLRDLASMKFRGTQPQTADEWHQLYLFLSNTIRRRTS